MFAHICTRYSRCKPPNGAQASGFGIVASAFLVLAGCGPKPLATSQPATHELSQSLYPPRPTTRPPVWKLFHHDATSFTIVAAEDTTDEGIEALVWQLHDAARAHTFGQLSIDEKAVDARDPIVWFHIYRGGRCASEKYTSGKLPCGASYHAAGDYTLGSFKNPQRDEGVLLHDEDHTVELWDADATASAAKAAPK